MEYKKGLIGMLIIVNILLSVYLIYLDITKQEGLCLTGQGCKIVRESPYNKLFGIPLAWFGLLSFSLFLAVFIADYYKKIPKYILPTISLIGAFYAIYFLSIQAFLIGAFCSTCIAADSIALILAVLIWHDYYKYGHIKQIKRR
jgi:uncharacterized membrane protein